MGVVNWKLDGTPTQANGKERRSLAAQASQDCVFCSGNGLVTVYHPRFQGHTIGMDFQGRTVALTVAAHCLCDLGRFLRDQCPEDVRRRVPDMVVINAGRTYWRFDPPGHEEDCQNPARRADASSFKALWARIRSGRIGQKWPVNPGRHTHEEIAESLERRAAS